MAKKGVKGSAITSSGSKWEQNLSLALFQEPDWKAFLTFIAENRPVDVANVTHLNTAIAAGSRRLVTAVTRQGLLKEVNQYGNPKTRPKDAPLYVEVCEVCKVHLDNKEEIPSDLLARLIKYKLMSIKTEDIKKRHGVNKTPESKKGKGGRNVKSAGKKGAAVQKSPEQSIKQGTQLKKRSEEILDQKFIDDEPEDGPQHYIIISGFYDSKVLVDLSDIDIHIDTVLKYGCTDYSGLETPGKEKGNLIPKDSKMIAAEEAAAAENERIRNGTKTFWEELIPLLTNQPANSSVHHTHVMDYFVKQVPNLEKTETNVAYGAELFDDMANTLYKLVEKKRQYENYIQNIKLIPVPESEQLSKPTSAGPSDAATPLEAPTQDSVCCADMRYYNDLMDVIPLESVTVPIVVHCMVEQVVATEDQIEPPGDYIPPPTSDGLHQDVATHLSDVIQKLSLDEDCRSVMADMLIEEKTPAKRILQLLNYNDGIAKRYHHLEPVYDFDPLKVENEMLERHSLFGPSVFPDISSDKKSLEARAQEFFYFCSKGDAPPAVINYVLQQNVLESLPVAGVSSSGALQSHKPSTVLAWDHPYYMLQTKGLLDLENPNADIPSDEHSLLPNKVFDDCTPSQCSIPYNKNSSVLPSPYSSSVSGGQSRGILKSSPSNSDDSEISSKSPTVQFKFNEAENDDSGEKLDRSFTLMTKDSTEIMEYILSERKRNLENWNCVEHFEPKVFQQVLLEASYQLPYCEKYHHLRDNYVFIVLYNPCNTELYNQESWHIQLHSNVGFRNYMLYVADLIKEWTQEEEKKYRDQLQAENEQKKLEQQLAATEAATAEKMNEKNSKEGKKSPSKKSAQSPTKSPQLYESLFVPEGEFLRPGSLKAQKREEELLKAELEEKDKKKRQKSPKKQEKSVEKEKEKRSSSRLSLKSQKSSRSLKSLKEDSEFDVQPSDDVLEEEPEPPFTGYDVGDNIVKLTGSKYTMFPKDGGQIRVETTQFLNGQSSVRTSVVKNGHVISVHLLNPRELEEVRDGADSDPKEADGSKSNLKETLADLALSMKAGITNNISSDNNKEMEVAEEEEEGEEDASVGENGDSIVTPAFSDFGSVTAVLADGMTLSFSQFGSTGYYSSPSPADQSEASAPQDDTVTSPLPSREATTGRLKKSDKKKGLDVAETVKTPDGVTEKAVEQMKEPPSEIPYQPFQDLHLTCPDGLKIEYFLESSVGIEPRSPDMRRLLVRQSYPYRCNGIQSCELTRSQHSDLEEHRIIVPDGTVIKKMRDGTYQVLYVDGTIAKCESLTEEEKAMCETPDLSLNTSSRYKIPTDVGTSLPIEMNCKGTDQVKWTITHPSGQKFVLTPDGKKVYLPKVLFSMKSDIKSGQSMLTRDDHVILISETSGKTVVEHRDGTRITTYYEEVPSVKAEDSNSSPYIEHKPVMFTMVECPSYATLKFNARSSENLTLLGNGTMINVFPDGFYHILLDGRYSNDKLELDLDGTLTYLTMTPDSNDTSLKTETRYFFKHNANIICETTDSDGNTFQVNHKGQQKILLERKNSDDSGDSPKSKEQQQISEYGNHAPRYFILHPDGSGDEVLSDEKVASFLREAEKDPKCIVLRDMFQDQPGVFGITFLKPYDKTISDQWLVDYEQDCIIPLGIRYQTTIDPSAERDMKRQTSKCPDVLEIRQFTQYPMLDEDIRLGVEQGLHDYIEYCFQRFKHLGRLQVVDSRTSEEQKLASAIQDFVNQLPEVYYRPQLDDDMAKKLYEEGATSSNTLPEEEQNQQDNIPLWEKIPNDFPEEEIIKKALRNQEIPKYFDSVFGRTFLESEEERELNERLKKLCCFTVPPATTASDEDSTRTKTSIGLSNSSSSTSKPDCILDQISPVTKGLTTGHETDHELRPVNPSPTHASGHGSPTAVRPTNPTPTLQKTKPMQERSENPIGREADSASIPEIVLSPMRPMIKELSKLSDTSDCYSTDNKSGNEKPLEVSTIGQPQFGTTAIPVVLRGGRPYAQPNEKFQNTEEPVRRQVHNSMLVGPSIKSQQELKKMRGLDISPEEINFGVLREGSTYVLLFYLRNTGVDSCRFKLKQPPPATGLQVLYQPGPIAAGLKLKLVLELYAIAVGVEQEVGVGSVQHNLQITTETDILYLPVHATILTAHEYDRQQVEKKLDSQTTSAQLVSTKSPGTQGIIRPKRKMIKAVNLPENMYSRA